MRFSRSAIASITVALCSLRNLSRQLLTTDHLIQQQPRHFIRFPSFPWFSSHAYLSSWLSPWDSRNNALHTKNSGYSEGIPTQAFFSRSQSWNSFSLSLLVSMADVLIRTRFHFSGRFRYYTFSAHSTNSLTQFPSVTFVYKPCTWSAVRMLCLVWLFRFLERTLTMSPILRIISQISHSQSHWFLEKPTCRFNSF